MIFVGYTPETFGYTEVMPTISFVKGQPDIIAAPGENLMEALMKAGLPVASSCGGEGVCCKCVIKIISGIENLSERNATETDLKEIHDLSRNERVSCQTQVNGDIKVDTDYW
jgi:2Fe-2S ferredoxin